MNHRQYELVIHIINKMIGISNKTFIEKFVVILSKVIRFLFLTIFHNPYRATVNAKNNNKKITVNDETS